MTKNEGFKRESRSNVGEKREWFLSREIAALT